MSDNAELKHILNRIYHALSHNPEGLNLVDIQNLCKPYYEPLSPDDCKHIYSILDIYPAKCLKCGTPEHSKSDGDKYE